MKKNSKIISKGKSIKTRKGKVQWVHHRRISCVHLPLDLITKILLWLPPKSLARFMSVSKSWHAILRSAHFAFQYLEHSKTRPPHLMIGALDTHFREKIDFYTCDLGSRSKKANFVFTVHLDEEQKGLQAPQHCNGLVLLNTTNHLHVCNPSTRAFETLPEGSDDDEDVFDCIAGLGFVPGDNAYKVARYVYAFPGHEGRLEVYTLGKDSSWRVIEEDPPYPISMASSLMPGGESVYFRIDETAGPPSRKAFVRFSLREEKFHVVCPPPVSGLTDCSDVSIVDLDGDPCFVHCSGDGRKYDLWVLCSGDGRRWWAHRFSIGLEQPGELLRPIAVRGGRILVSVRGRSELYGRLQYYDPGSRSFELVAEIEGSFAELRKNHDVDVACYVESLVR